MILWRVRRIRNKVRHLLKRCIGPPAPPGSEMSSRQLRGLIGRRDPIILEIGAHSGGHTRWFLECFPKARVFCFEPDPRALLHLQRNVGSDSRVTIVPMAIGRASGRLVFHQSSGRKDSYPADYVHIDSGSLRRPTGHLEKHPWVRFDSTIEVECTTLDEFAAQYGIDSVDFVWMDVQGAECDVICGGTRTFQSVRVLFTEYSNAELYEGQWDLQAILGALPGFRVVRQFKNDVLLAGPGFRGRWRS